MKHYTPAFGGVFSFWLRTSSTLYAFLSQSFAFSFASLFVSNEAHTANWRRTMQLKQIGINDWNDDAKPLFYDAEAFPGDVRWMADTFLVQLQKRTESYIALKAFKFHGRMKLANNTGWQIVTIDDDAELYLEATIKWDCCSHFNFGDEDGYQHLCGGSCFAQHITLMKGIYEWAYELLDGHEEHKADMWGKECVDTLFGGAQ